jgi:importin subunit alpha-6/7
MEIYEKAFNIIQTYFGNDEEDQQLAPATDNNQFQFNVSTDAVPMDGFHF